MNKYTAEKNHRDDILTILQEAAIDDTAAIQRLKFLIKTTNNLHLDVFIRAGVQPFGKTSVRLLAEGLKNSDLSSFRLGSIGGAIDFGNGGFQIVVDSLKRIDTLIDLQLDHLDVMIDLVQKACSDHEQLELDNNFKY